jgi:hypothetical protein
VPWQVDRSRPSYEHPSSQPNCRTARLFAVLELSTLIFAVLVSDLVVFSKALERQA